MNQRIAAGLVVAARHLGVWNQAYLRGVIYAMIAGLSDFLSRTELDGEKLAAMTWLQWFRIALFAMLAATIAVRAYLDSTVGKIQERQDMVFSSRPQQP